jgi:hypothetical protein
VAFLLTACVALLPWGLVFGVMLFPLKRMWRRRRERKLAELRTGK